MDVYCLLTATTTIRSTSSFAPELKDEEQILRNVLERLFIHLMKHMPPSRLARGRKSHPPAPKASTSEDDDASKSVLGIEAFGHCFTLFGPLCSSTLQEVRIFEKKSFCLVIQS